MDNVVPLAPNAWLRWDTVQRRMPRSACRVLEIGCGQGAFGSRFAAVHRYTAVEPDPVAHAVASKRISAVSPDARVLNGDVGALGDDDVFDVLCAFEVIEHIEDDRGALAHWVERVRPGGLVLLSAPAWLERMGPWDEAVGHYRRYDPKHMHDLLRHVGLVESGVQVYGAPLGYALEWSRDRLAGRGGHHAEKESGEQSMQTRTARSGRVLQPSSALTGTLTRVGTLPFRWIQRAFPTKGTGLVAWGTIPA